MKRICLFLTVFLFASIGNAATSVAFVKGQATQTIFIAWSQPNQAIADALALKGCRGLAKKAGTSAKCVVGGRYAQLGFGAIVCGKGDCAWVTGRASAQAAADDAYRECVAADTADCNGTDIMTWTEKVGGVQPAIKPSAPARQCSPPAGRAVRSTTRCNNGACSRTFENGCTVQFQAPYCHNPFSGQWEWKPDGC
ncbi:MAG: hypothetical protein ABWY27_16540 [Telluria sp.]